MTNLHATMTTCSRFRARGRLTVALLLCAIGVVWTPLPAFAQTAHEASPSSPAIRQPPDEAWWTGPMLANSAATLPRGHFLIEPYVYDVTSPGTHGFGSRAYVLYGLVDRLTIGVIPIVGYNTVSGGPSSSRVGLGDITALAQYRLTQARGGGWIPTTSVEVQETFPTGKYDRLGDRPSDGLGGGAQTTTLALNSQTFMWLPNGRILRIRLNVSHAFSGNVNVQDVSVYGTGSGFRGHAKPGDALFADAAWEYSVTRSWVLALDVVYSHNRSTRVTGTTTLDSGPSEAFGFAPAIEYSWAPNLGVLVGTRIIAAGPNTTRTISPAIAVNFFR